MQHGCFTLYGDTCWPDEYLLPVKSSKGKTTKYFWSEAHKEKMCQEHE
jgi:hypothetical protein